MEILQVTGTHEMNKSVSTILRSRISRGKKETTKMQHESQNCIYVWQVLAFIVYLLSWECFHLSS